MLTITRRIGEAFVIDERIRVVLREYDRGQVKVMIDAPPEMHVRRDELPPRPGDEMPRR